jgi:hypothetical protein
VIGLETSITGIDCVTKLRSYRDICEDVQEKLGMPLRMGGAVGAAGTSPSRGRVSNRGPADEDLRWHAASLAAAAAAAAAAADQRS